jgi:hypothetical protein
VFSLNEVILENILIACNKILSELQLLTSGTKASALVRFQADFLNTEQQKKIYEAIDGEKDTKKIAETTGASIRYVQLYIKALAEKDLIDSEKKANSNIPKKAIAKIATYYAAQDINISGGEKSE